MNSELEKLIEKYRITVNGLADLESDYEKVIKERGFVTLNGLLVDGTASLEESDSPSGESTVNTENAPVADGTATIVDPAPVEPTPVVPAAPAPSESSEEHNTNGAPAVDGAASNEEHPDVTPVPSEPAVSGDTNLGNEVAGGERSAEENPEENSDNSEEGDDTASTEDPAAGGKPKKKKK